MLKALLVTILMISSFSSFAFPLENMMTVKERLRLSLWVEGLSDQKKIDSPQKQRPVLPEEIERALRKM